MQYFEFPFVQTVKSLKSDASTSSTQMPNFRRWPDLQGTKPYERKIVVFSVVYPTRVSRDTRCPTQETSQLHLMMPSLLAVNIIRSGI